ncbi:MAG: hypothetical protein P8R42_20230 [Candidatus Binatia bacterium]|nr:hypothetical protein [Candidatus Binatia bacterium]
MSETRDKSDRAEAVEVRGSHDRTSALGAAVDVGVRARSGESPPLALGRTDLIALELQSLDESIRELRDCMGRFGEVTTTRTGFGGRVELALKGIVRKLVQRHLDQEKEVHVALQRVLERLSALRTAEHALLDENATVLVDDALRRDRRAKEG